MIPLLEAHQLSVLAGEKWACKGLDLSICQGEVWGVLGVNGAGKTSLLHALCGIREIQSGQIRLKGRPIAEMKRREAARIAGLLFQDSEDHFPSTVLETALIGRHPHIPPWQRESQEDEAIALEALSAVGLAGMAQRLANTLSGGERRRLALATLLVQDPALYLLDEPTNHLDLRHQIEVLDLLASRSAEKALVMVLHDPNLAERYCNRILMLLEEGQTMQGKKEDILNESSLSRLYNCPIASIQGPYGRIFFADQTVPASGLKAGCL